MPKVDPKLCIGCFACTIVYPELFEINQDGKAFAKKVSNLNEQKYKNAVEVCPTQAISD